MGCFPGPSFEHLTSGFVAHDERESSQRPLAVGGESPGTVGRDRLSTHVVPTEKSQVAAEEVSLDVALRVRDVGPLEESMSLRTACFLGVCVLACSASQ